MTRRMPTPASALVLLLLAGAGAIVPVARAASPAPARATTPHSVMGDMDCSACHTTGGWKMTGVVSGGAGGFDHSKTGFPLTGEHHGAACLGCHVPDRVITRECAGCHEDSHEGRLGATCDQCHTARGWSDVQASAAHRRTRFPLTGMHTLIDCTACHLRDGGRSFSDAPADCFACHEDDYRSNDNHPRHEGDPITGDGYFSRQCTECHTTAGWVPAFLPAVFLALEAGPRGRLQHEPRFPIARGRHRDAECEDCHSGAADGRGRVDCTGCHEHSPFRLAATHRGFPTDGGGCVRCHPGGVRR